MDNRTTWTKDIKRDAALVHAAMNNVLEPLATGMGMSPDETFVHHPTWLKRQSTKYREQVVQAVIELEKK